MGQFSVEIFRVNGSNLSGNQQSGRFMNESVYILPAVATPRSRFVIGRRAASPNEKLGPGTEWRLQAVEILNRMFARATCAVESHDAHGRSIRGRQRTREPFARVPDHTQAPGQPAARSSPERVLFGSIEKT